MIKILMKKSFDKMVSFYACLEWIKIRNNNRFKEDDKNMDYYPIGWRDMTSLGGYDVLKNINTNNFSLIVRPISIFSQSEITKIQ